MSKYQHTIPVGIDDPGYHEEEPIPKGPKNSGGYFVTYTCRYCDKQLIRVDENEGPENLKALLRF